MTPSEFDSGVAFLIMLNPLSVYAILFGMLLLCGFGLPVPEDIILITGGYLSYEGLLNVHVMAVIGLFGVLAGDFTMYFIGAKFGQHVLGYGLFAKLISRKKMEDARNYLQRYGDKIFFFARFLPGLRAPVFFTGGFLHVRFHLLAVFDSLAALISVPVWVYCAWYWGEYIDKVIVMVKKAESMVIMYGLGGILALILVCSLKKYILKRNAKTLPE